MIREANINDYKDIRRLISILEEREYDEERMLEVFTRQLKDEYQYCYVYETDHIVGMITLLVKETLHHCDITGEIIELCVDPECRNQKIGQQLLEYIENKAKELKLSELELSSNVKRKDAHRFYERHLYNKDHYNFTKKINH